MARSRVAEDSDASLRADVAKPFLKWAGGKWSLAAEIAELLPCDLEARTYREPFVGGGALFFWLKKSRAPKKVVLTDTLGDLVNTYEVVRDDVEALLAKLEALRDAHSKEHFYEVRERFNSRKTGSRVERAAWLVYLNKTCFNGLFRTNRSGIFNVPFGRFVNPNIADHARLRAASKALAGVEIAQSKFDHLEKKAKKGNVIYLDPPYVPLSKTANFAAYDGAFGPEDQRRLADLFRELDARGCLLALSNSDTEEVRRLYKGFDIRPIRAARNISASGSTRAPVTELLVRNVKRYPRG